MTAYDIAYHNAHMDSDNPAKWAAVRREAIAMNAAATTDADKMRWLDTAMTARVYWWVARTYGVSPLSDEGREIVADRLGD